MGNDDLITQMGLMLTQLRYARRALEDIERSTARYAGFAFASALQAGSSFGAPPMLDGALKVHVVNINDLAPGSGFGGFLESLLGGVGRFFGGLLGGFVGGTISGFNLPGIILAMQDLAKHIEKILGMLGMSFAEGSDKKKTEETPTLLTQWKDILKIVDKFTLLFTAASNPDKADQMVKQDPKDADQWLNILKTAKALVSDISHVVDGLIILIPTLIGGLASLVVHLRDVQTAVLDLLQFLMKEIFLLRGVLLFTLWDTIAGAAHLAAQVLSMLNSALQTMIISIGGIFGKLFDAGLAILKILGEGLKQTANTLLRWLVDSVGVVLNALGESKIFRVVVYMVQSLPALLPPLLQLLDKPLLDTDRAALTKAAENSIKEPDFPPNGKTLSDMISEFPDLPGLFSSGTKIAGFSDEVKKAFEGVQDDLKKGFAASITALNDISDKLNEVKKDKSFIDALDERKTKLRDSSSEFAKTLTEAQKKLEDRPENGLKLIATAYEDWLVHDGGMKSVLEKIEAHFKASKDTSVFGPPMSPSTVERPRATVEIKELLIQLDPAGDSRQDSAPHSLNTDQDWPDEPLDRFERLHILKARGGTALDLEIA